MEHNLSLGIDALDAVYDPANGYLYLSDGISHVDSFNTSEGRVTTIVDVGTPTKSPGSMSVDPARNQVYVPAIPGSGITVIDGSINRVTAQIGAIGAPMATVFDQQNRMLYVAGLGLGSFTVKGNGTVSMVNVTSQAVVGSLNVSWYPDGMALDASSHLLFIANGKSDTVSVIDTIQWKVVGQLPVGAWPSTPVYDAQNGRVYVHNVDSGNISVIDGSTLAELGSIQVGGTYENGGMALDPVDQELFVGSNYTALTAVSVTTASVVGAIKVWLDPSGIAFDAQSQDIYAASFPGSLLQISPRGDCVVPLAPPWWSLSELWLTFLFAPVVVLVICVLVLWQRKRRKAALRSATKDADSREAAAKR